MTKTLSFVCEKHKHTKHALYIIFHHVASHEKINFQLFKFSHAGLSENIGIDQKFTHD